MLALIDRRRRGDYLLLAALGALPSLLAWQFGLHRSLQFDGDIWVGFFDKANMWPQVVLLPLFAFLVRWALGRVADVAAPNCPENAPPIVRAFPVDQQADAYAALRRTLASPGVFAALAGLVLLLMALDTANLVHVYLTDDPRVVAERDWSVMYLTGSASKLENALLVLSCYLMQTMLFLFRFLAIVFLFLHNLFFLRHLWQRRRVASGRPLIAIDLDDPERCLGLRPIGAAFNTQAVLAGLGGAAILLSRYAQASGEAGLSWADVLRWPPRIEAAVGFPDTGQWILAVAWTMSMTTILLPLAAKWQPLFGPRGPELELGEFLREFLRGERRGAGNAPERFEAQAAQFAAQAFWPAGDNRARMLLTFSLAVLLIVLYPLKIADASLLLASMVVLAAIAALLMRLTFVLLRLPLAFVDDRLVDGRRSQGGPEALARPATIAARLFLSYRREDSRAYTRLLQKALLERMPADRLFLDLESLEAGEDFVDRIDAAVAASDALLVVIGPGWLEARNPDGGRRIDDADDFVAREVACGLAHDRVVIPVLVGGASMPAAADLPPALASLGRRQAHPLDDSHWDYDVEQLVARLAELDPAAPRS